MATSYQATEAKQAAGWELLSYLLLTFAIDLVRFCDTCGAQNDLN